MCSVAQIRTPRPLPLDFLNYSLSISHYFSTLLWVTSFSLSKLYRCISYYLLFETNLFFSWYTLSFNWSTYKTSVCVSVSACVFFLWARFSFVNFGLYLCMYVCTYVNSCISLFFLSVIIIIIMWFWFHGVRKEKLRPNNVWESISATSVGIYWSIHQRYPHWSA